MDLGTLHMTRSARRHRVGSTHIREVLEDADEPYAVDGKLLLFVGKDSRGEELEIGIFPDERQGDGWVVVHAMPTKYRRRQEEGEK
jgi:hypothetical protein